MNIYLNDDNFRYDIHSLVRAFYPNEELNYFIYPEDELNNHLPKDYRDAALDENLKASYHVTFDKELHIYIPKESKGDRLQAKNEFKKQIYELFSEKNKKTLPWGTLTGIRPVKIPAKLIRENKSKEEIHRYMKDTYLISDEKEELLYNIAKKEHGILSGIDMDNSYSLYIGIPFCPSICAYCSFSSYPISQYKDKVVAYIEALKKELHFVGDRVKDRNLISIYVGGGTPSILNEDEIDDLIRFIKSEFNLSCLKEFSFECGRPDSITKEKLLVLKEHGVNRISINPQTLNDKTLNRIGRRHSSQDFYKAYELATHVGIPVINCDLIAGLPAEEIDDIKFTLNKIKDISPNNLTVHSLSIKRASELNLKRDEITKALSDEMFSLFTDAAKEMGLYPYYLYRQKQISGNLENIGFSKTGLECIYNMLIMGEYHNIIACGANAISKIIKEDKKPERVVNIKDVDLYIKKIDEMIERKKIWL